jgi:hypothetical protein
MILRSSGQAALVLDTIEPILNQLVRKGRIDPPPPIVAGRRQWSEASILSAARALGLSEECVRLKLAEVTRG